MTFLRSWRERCEKLNWNNVTLNIKSNPLTAIQNFSISPQVLQNIDLIIVYLWIYGVVPDFKNATEFYLSILLLKNEEINMVFYV